MANCSAAVLARLARLTGLREAPYQVLHLATGYGDFPIADVSGIGNAANARVALA